MSLLLGRLHRLAEQRVFTVANACGSLQSITTFRRCAGVGERAWCEIDAMYRFPGGQVRVTGNVEISRQNGGLVGTQRISHVTTSAGTNASGLTPGAAFRFRPG